MIFDCYEKAKSDFKDWSRLDSSIIPFEFGEVGVKGVSDLDLGIILSRVPSINIKDHINDLPESIFDLMNGGTLMIFPKKIFNLIHFIDNVNVNFLSEVVPIDKLSINETEIVSIIQVIEWMPERLLRLYQDMDTGFKNPKRSLAYLYSYCYTLKKIKSLVFSSDAMEKYIDEVRKSRLDWLTVSSSKRYEILQNLNEFALSITQSVIDIFLQHPIVGLLSNQIKRNNDISFNLHSNVYIKETINEKYSINKDVHNNISINVPSIFLHTYIKYAISNSRLSNLICKRFNKLPDNLDIYKDRSDFNLIMNKRFEFMNECYGFISSLSLQTGLYKFGWYL